MSLPPNPLTLPHAKAVELLKNEARRRTQGKRQPLAEFIPRISPRFTSPRHLQPLLEKLDLIPAEPQRLIVSVPPRHSKSETLLHFMALYLSQHPDRRVAYASYAQTFSETQALKAQRYARAAGVTEDDRMANRKDWQTWAGGGIFATGVGGEFTGRGADLLIIDDPVANPAQANSPTYRDKVWAWFEDVAETRLEPGGSVVVLMTRWHADDLTGRLIKHRPEYTVIRIPALADGLDALGRNTARDPLGRAHDEALWPARYDAPHLLELREKKPYTFTSLYQGLPRPKGDHLFGDVHHYTVLPSGGRTVIGVDTAYAAKRRANFTAVTVWTVIGDAWYLRHADKWQEAIPVTIERLAALQRTYGGTMAVEANGPQRAVFDLLEDKGLRVQPVIRVSDKYAEAQEYAESWASGTTLLPDPSELPRSWYVDFVEQHQNFTGVNDAEDDYVDSGVNARTLSVDTMPDARATLSAMRAVAGRR